jgi:hypothetical protein
LGLAALEFHFHRHGSPQTFPTSLIEQFVEPGVRPTPQLLVATRAIPCTRGV